MVNSYKGEITMSIWDDDMEWDDDSEDDDDIDWDDDMDWDDDPELRQFKVKKGELIEYTGDEYVVVIPYGVTRIGDDVFAHREYLMGVEFPEGVQSIG